MLFATISVSDDVPVDENETSQLPLSLMWPSQSHLGFSLKKIPLPTYVRFSGAPSHLSLVMLVAMDAAPFAQSSPEACVQDIFTTTWLPPSYTVCELQHTSVPCDEPVPTITCPGMSATLQSQPTASTATGSKLNGTPASQSTSQGGSGSGSLGTGAIVGFTVAAVALLALCLALVRKGFEPHRYLPTFRR